MTSPNDDLSYIFNPDYEDMVWTPSTDKSNVEHPTHYNQGDIECIDAMLAAGGKDSVKSFCHLSCFKYLWRFKHKNGTEDLKKAEWYLKKLIELSKLD